MKDSKERICVLFFSHSAMLGGAELSLLLLVSGMDKAIFKPVVIVPASGPLEQELKKLDVVVAVAPTKRWIPSRHKWGWWDFRSQFSALKTRIRVISQLIDQHNIDIVYTNTITMLDGALMALYKRKPHIWHAREYLTGNDDIKSYLPHSFIRAVMGCLSKKILVNSRSLAAEFRTFFTKSKLTVVYNSVDIDAFLNFKPDDNNIRTELGLKPEHQIVVYIGNLSERKDLVTFIKAASMVKAENNQSVFILVGEGHDLYKAELKHLIDDYELTPFFYFLGKRQDIPRIMHDVDVLILPSRQEAFGKVIIEAMAMEKPVVATLSGGPEEIVINEKTGYLIPVADENKMAERTITLLSNPSLSQQFGQAGRQRVLKCFDYNSYITGIEQTIKDVHQQSTSK